MIASGEPRLLALDLDGTVLGPDGDVPPRTRVAIERLRAGGVHVVLASGRVPTGMLRLCQELGLDDYQITMQGALIVSPLTGSVLAAWRLEPAEARAHIAFARQAGAVPLLCFAEGFRSEILVPEIDYITNDAWPLASGLASGIPYPLLLQARYASGSLYVLTVPENFGDIYNLPAGVLNPLRRVLTRNLFVRLQGPAQVSLFAYNNNTFIVESFLSAETGVKVSVPNSFKKLRNLVTGAVTTGEDEAQGRFDPGERRTGFSVPLPPHSYTVFAAE